MHIEAKSWSCNTCTNQTLNKDYNQGQKRTLHNDKWIIPTMRHNDYKYSISQSTHIKEILRDIKREIETNDSRDL